MILNSLASMKKSIIALLASVMMLLPSCIESFELQKEEEEVIIPVPSLTISEELLGSYSAQFVCNIEEVDRVFFKGGFQYGTDPALQDPKYMPGIIVDNVLSVVVNDIQPNSTYYYKAVITDDNGSVESSVGSFSSTVFKVADADYSLGCEGGEIAVAAESSIALEYSVNEAGWITPLGSNRFAVAANETFFDRFATITISTKDGIFKATVSVGQDQSPLRFKSEAFRKLIVSEYDANQSGELELAEFDAVTSINAVSDDVDDISEIAYFKNLSTLVCAGSEKGKGLIREVDLSANRLLKEIDLSNNALVSLDLSSADNLSILRLGGNALESLDLSGNPLLEVLDVAGNRLTSLDLGNNHSLIEVDCSSNGMASLRGIESSALASISCNDNHLEALDLSGAKALLDVACHGNSIKELDITSLLHLKTLDCSSNILRELYTRKNAELEALDCHSNEIAAMDVRYNTALRQLDCHDNRLAIIDVLRNAALEDLDCSGNDITLLDVENCLALKALCCKDNPLDVLFIGQGQSVPGVTVERSADMLPERTSIRTHKELVSIPDASFKAYLVSHFDVDGDGEISVDEGLAIKSINVSTDEVSSLSGIDRFVNLLYLKCSGSSDEFRNVSGKLKALDLSSNANLLQLICDNNRIEAIDVSGCPALRTLWCRNNRLRSIDISANKALEDLNCEGNLIAELDLAGNPGITSLDCSPMNDVSGANCLAWVNISAGMRIDFINGLMNRRSVSNIPGATILSIDYNENL